MLRQRFLNAMGFKPRNGAADGYQFDLDGSERFVRPRHGIDIFPTQTNVTDFAKIGCMNAVYPLQNSFVWAQAYGKIPFGPIMSVIPDNLQWQVVIAGLNKQNPQY